QMEITGLGHRYKARMGCELLWRRPRLLQPCKPGAACGVISVHTASPREKRNETGCPTLLRCSNRLGMKYPDASIRAVNPALPSIHWFHEQRLNLEEHRASGGQDVDRES